MGRALDCEMDDPGFEPAHVIKTFFFRFLRFLSKFFFIHVIAVTLGTAFPETPGGNLAWHASMAMLI